LGDEPTGEVDSVTAQVIMDTFRRLSRRLDLTTIIVTHDPRIAEQVDRVVAIRDGKISTETIRQVSQLEHVMAGEPVSADAEHGPETPHMREHITFEEFVVLDSAGRLQIPKEIREDLGIGKRAYMEMGDNCIVIRPVENEEDDSSRKLTLEEQIAMLFASETAPVKKPGSVKRLKLPGWK